MNVWKKLNFDIFFIINWILILLLFDFILFEFECRKRMEKVKAASFSGFKNIYLNQFDHVKYVAEEEQGEKEDWVNFSTNAKFDEYSMEKTYIKFISLGSQVLSI